MLHRFRNASNSIIAKVLFVLIILSFAAWGLTNVFTTGGSEMRLEKVGGRDISIQMLDRQMDQDIQRISAMFGFPITKAQAIQFGFSNRVLENLIKSHLLELEAQDVGLRPSEAAIFSFVKADPNFQDKEGQFNADLMRQVLKANQLSEKLYFNLISSDIQKALLSQAITVPVKIPDIISKTLYQYENELRNVNLYLVSEAAIGEIDPPTELEIQAFYEKYKEDYQVPEMRSFSVIEISANHMSASVNVTEDEVKDFYTDNKKLFDIPETRQVDQLVAKDEAAAEAIKVALSNGGNPTEIAKENDGNYISLKKISQKDMFFPQLGETVFALQKGEVSTPIQTPIGWIITKVNKIYPSTVPDFNQVKDQARALLLADQVKAKREETLEAFEEDIQSDLPFTDVAKKYGVPLLTFSKITRESSQTDKALDKFIEKDQLIEKAFSAIETEESDVIESRNGSLLAFRVNDIMPLRLKTLDENRQTIVKDWIAAQKLDRAKQMGEQLAKDANQPGNNLRKLARSKKLATLYSGNIKRSAVANKKSKLVLAPYIFKEIYALEKLGADSFDANGSVYVYQLNKIIPTSMRGYKRYKSDIDQQLSPQLLGSLQDQFVQALSKKYDVKLYPNNMRVYIDSVLQQ